MSAAIMVQAAIVARLQGVPGLAGCQVFDMPPLRSALPHAVVEEPVLGDWSTKTWTGREGRIVVTAIDGGERPVRLRALVGALEEAVEGIAPTVGAGWHVVQLRLVRSRMARVTGDRWRATSEFLVRMYRES